MPRRREGAGRPLEGKWRATTIDPAARKSRTRDLPNVLCPLHFSRSSRSNEDFPINIDVSYAYEKSRIKYFFTPVAAAEEGKKRKFSSSSSSFLRPDFYPPSLFLASGEKESFVAAALVGRKWRGGMTVVVVGWLAFWVAYLSMKILPKVLERFLFYK